MSKALGVIARLRDLVSPGAARRRTDDEITFHLDMETERLVRAGVPRDEARRRSVATFGGVQHHREHLANAPSGWLGDVGRDVRISARSLRRSPGFTVSAIASLALGFALAASVVSVVTAYLARALPYPSPERLFHMMYAPPGPVEPRGVSVLDWASLRDVVEAPVSTASASYYLSDPAFSRTVRRLAISPGSIGALGIRVIAGRNLVPDDFRNDGGRPALIGHAFWRERFGSDSSIIGRDIRAERESGTAEVELFRVVGIVAPGFWFGRNSSEGVDIITPLLTPTRTYMVQLADGVSQPQAESRLTSVVRNTATWLPDRWPGVRLESVHERYIGSIRPVLRAVVVAAALVLVITCVNVAVLLLLRALRRQREVAVRIALGAGQASLARMFLVEVGLICAAAVALALVVATPTLRIVGNAIETQLGRPAPGGPSAIGVNSTVFIAVGGIGVAVAVLLSLVPALTTGSRRLSQSLRGSGRAASDSRSMQRVRFALVTLEIAGSLALLTGCALMIRSAMRMSDVDLGMDTRGLVRSRIVLRGASYPTPVAFEQFYVDATSRVAAKTGATPSFGGLPPYWEPPPLRVETTTGIARGGASEIIIGLRHFSTVGIPLRIGREFRETDRSVAEPVAIVSESAAREYWPGMNAIGQRVRALPPDQPGAQVPVWRTVIGVVSDARQTYDDQTARDIYVPYLQGSASRYSSVYIRSDRPLGELAPLVRAAVAEIDPLAIVNELTHVASEDRRLSQARFISTLLSAFAVLAAVLAMLGIYGVVAYAVKQREREMAIRIAVGASRPAIIRLFLGTGGWMIGAGLALGLVGAAAVGRVLSSQLFGVTPFDLPTIAIVSALLGGATLTATLLPARRAAATSPIVALNSE